MRYGREATAHLILSGIVGERGKMRISLGGIKVVCVLATLLLGCNVW